MKVDKISIRIRILYGIGAAAASIRMTLFGLFSLFLYTSLLGLPGTLVGIGAAISLLWDALIDPYIGALSDKSRGRLGKRHGLMLLGSLTMGLAFWAFFSAPTGLPTWALFSWALLFGILARTGSSLFIVPYYALGAELTLDYHERTTIVAIRTAFALFFTLVTVVVSFVLFFPSDLKGDPDMTIESYRAMGGLAGLLMTVTALVATVGTLGQRQYATLESEVSRPLFKIRDSFDALRNALSIPSFRILFFSYALFFLSVVINATLGIHFLAYYVEIGSGRSFGVFQLSFYVGAIIGVFVWAVLARQIEKWLLYLCGIAATSLAMAGAYLLFGEGRLFGTGNLFPIVIAHGLAGLFGSVLWVVPASMLADVVDEDEVQTGRRQEGALFGLFSFAEQLAAGLAILIAGILIDVFAGLVPGQLEQSAVTVERIGILYGVVPAALVLLSGIVVWNYRLTEDRVSAYQARLNKGRSGAFSDSSGPLR